MKEFDLYNFMLYSTIIAIVVALLFQIDYSWLSVQSDAFGEWLHEPFQWTNGWYLYIVCMLLTINNFKK